MKRIVTLLALPALALAATAVAQDPAADVKARLAAAGYAEVRDVEFDGGLWEAEVRRADGKWGEIAFDAAKNEVFDAKSGKALLDMAAVMKALEAGGYRDVSDLERDGALWDAEAVDAKGQRVELRISGYDGRVVSSDAEYDD